MAVLPPSPPRVTPPAVEAEALEIITQGKQNPQANISASLSKLKLEDVALPTIADLARVIQFNQKIPESERVSRLQEIISLATPQLPSMDCQSLRKIVDISYESGIALPCHTSFIVENLTKKTSDYLLILQNPEVSLEDIVGILNLFSLSQIKPSPIYDAVADAIHKQIDKCHVHHISKIAERFALVEIRHEPLFQSLTCQLLKLLSEPCISPTDHLERLKAGVNLGLEENALIKLAGELTELTLHNNLSSADFATITYHFGKSGISNPIIVNLFQKIAEAILLQNSQGKFFLLGKDLANLAWGFAKLGIEHPALFDCIAQRSLSTISNFHLFQLSKIIWAFINTQNYHKPLFSAIAQNILGAIEKLTPHLLSTFSLYFSRIIDKKLLPPNLATALFKAIETRTLSLIQNFPPMELSLLSLAFASAGQDSPQLLQAIVQKTTSEEFFNSSSKKAVGIQARAFAKLRVHSQKFNQLMMAQESTRREMRDLLITKKDPEESSFANVETIQELHKKIASIDPKNLINIATAFSYLELPEKELFAAISRYTIPSIPLFTIKELTSLILAFAEQKMFQETSLFTSVQKALLEPHKIEQADSNNATDIAVAFDLSPVATNELYTAIADRAVAIIEEFSPLNAVEIASILARKEIPNKQPFFQALERELLGKGKLQDIEPVDLPDLAQAFFQADIPGEAPIFEAIAQRVMQTYQDFDIQEISTIVFLYSSERISCPSQEKLLEMIREELHKKQRILESIPLVKSYKAQDLVYITLALQKLGILDTETLKLFTHISFAIIKKSEEFDNESIITLIQAFSLIPIHRVPLHKLYMAIGQEWITKGRLPQIPLEDLAEVLATYADDHFIDHPLFDAIFNLAREQIEQVDIHTLGLFAYSMRTSKIEYPALSQALEQEIFGKDKLQAASERDLCNILQGYESPKTSPVIYEKMAEKCSTIPTFEDYDSLKKITSIFSKCPIKGPKVQYFLNQFFETAQELISTSSNTSQLVQALELSVIIQRNAPVNISEFTTKILPHLGQCSFEEISTLFWCVATLNTPYPPLLDRLSEIALTKIHEASLDDLAQTLWALAKLGIKEPIYTRLAHSIADTIVSQKEKISKVSTQTLAKTPKAFLDLGITPSPDLFILIIEETERRLTECSPELLQIQLSSLEKMEIPRSEITSLHSVVSKKFLVEESYKTFPLTEIQFWASIFSRSPQKSSETQKFLEVLIELVISQMKGIDTASLKVLFHMISIEQLPQTLKEKLFSALAERLNMRVVIQDFSPEEILEWASLFSTHKIACSQTKKLLDALAFALCTPEKWPLLLADPSKVEPFIYQLADLGLRGPGSTKLLTSLAKNWYPLITPNTPLPRLLHEIIAVFYALAKLEIHFADEKPLIQGLAIELTKQMVTLPMEPFANFTWSLGKNHLDPHLLDINHLASATSRNIPNLSPAQLAKVISGFRRLDLHSDELLLLFFDRIMKDFESFTLQEWAEIANYIAVKTWRPPAERTRATRNIRDLGVPLLHRILVKLQPLIEQVPSRDLAHIVRSVSECDLIENASEFNRTFLKIMEDVLKRIPKALVQRSFNHEDYATVLMGFVLIKQNQIFFRIPKNFLSTIIAPLLSKSSLEAISKNRTTFTIPELFETITGLMYFGINETLLLDELAKELLGRKLEEMRPDVREMNMQGLKTTLEFAARSHPEYTRQPFFIKLMEIYKRYAPKPS